MELLDLLKSVIEAFIQLFGGDVQGLLVSILAFTVAVSIFFLVRWTGVKVYYDNHKAQLDYVGSVAADVILQIAFPADAAKLAEQLDYYTNMARQREESGLAWVDPRVLYAIDRMEAGLPEPFHDLNIIIDRVEMIYRQVKDAGLLEGREKYWEMPEGEATSEYNA